MALLTEKRYAADPQDYILWEEENNEALQISPPVQCAMGSHSICSRFGPVRALAAVAVAHLNSTVTELVRCERLHRQLTCERQG